MKEHIRPKDRLNLYLVENGLKPASMIDFFPKDIFNFDNYKYSQRKHQLPVDEEDTSKFEDYLLSKNLEFIKKGYEFTPLLFENKKKGFYHTAKYFVGKDKSSLERLVSAKSDKEIGLALGFPESAVESFGKVIEGEMRDGAYFEVARGKAKKSGIKIPKWVYYISFVPHKLDLVGGDIHKESEKLGTKYMNFVRKTHPELAKEIEDEKNHPLIPTSWEKTDEGSYNLGYNNFSHKNLK